MLMIDQAIRFKVSWPLESKDAPALGRALLKACMVYFGPPKMIVSDQEGGIKSDDFAWICDRFSIHRRLAGSDASGKHTSTTHLGWSSFKVIGKVQVLSNIVSFPIIGKHRKS